MQKLISNPVSSIVIKTHKWSKPMKSWWVDRHPYYNGYLEETVQMGSVIPYIYG